MLSLRSGKRYLFLHDPLVESPATCEPYTRGKVVKRGKLKVWTGIVPKVPLSEAVEQARRYDR